MEVNPDVVFTTDRANANFQPAYQCRLWMMWHLTVCNKATICSFPSFSKKSSTKLERQKHERQERKKVIFHWGVNVKDMEFINHCFFPEEEVTNNHTPGYEPALGEHWPNSNDAQAKVLVPETPELSIPNNQALPTTSIRIDSSESFGLPQAPRRNRK